MYFFMYYLFFFGYFSTGSVQVLSGFKTGRPYSNSRKWNSSILLVNCNACVVLNASILINCNRFCVGHGGRVVILLPPTSEAGVRFPARPQVGKLVVACHWLALYSTEP